MGECDEPMAMAESGKFRLVMLPRDPDRAYVYWESPPGEAETGRLTVFVEDGEQGRRQIDEFEVDDRCGGCFVTFDSPGALHTCRLEWGRESVETVRPVRAPTREPGDESPAFVRVRATGRGLEIEPTEHDHPVHGRFPAAKPGAGASSRLSLTNADDE